MERFYTTCIIYTVSFVHTMNWINTDSEINMLSIQQAHKTLIMLSLQIWEILNDNMIYSKNTLSLSLSFFFGDFKWKYPNNLSTPPSIRSATVYIVLWKNNWNVQYKVTVWGQPLSPLSNFIFLRTFVYHYLLTDKNFEFFPGLIDKYNFVWYNLFLFFWRMGVLFGQ